MTIGKELTKGSTAHLILRILSVKEMYGYQIRGEIKRCTQGELDRKEGTLYPILHAMVKAGLLESYDSKSESGYVRRYYRITAGGHLQMKLNGAEGKRAAHAADAVTDGEV